MPGYCPQFDALFDNLSARETLRIFCLLRGIPATVGAARALHLATTLGFIKHYDKKVHECSGGTKRKISTAVALLGDSPLIFLDEPTTGEIRSNHSLHTTYTTHLHCIVPTLYQAWTPPPSGWCGRA